MLYLAWKSITEGERTHFFYLVFGFGSVFLGCWLLVLGFWFLVGSWYLVVGCWFLVGSWFFPASGRGVVWCLGPGPGPVLSGLFLCAGVRCGCGGVFWVFVFPVHGFLGSCGRMGWRVLIVAFPTFVPISFGRLLASVRLCVCASVRR